MRIRVYSLFHAQLRTYSVHFFNKQRNSFPFFYAVDGYLSFHAIYIQLLLAAVYYSSAPCCQSKTRIITARQHEPI
jgi:hypothetical protein